MKTKKFIQKASLTCLAFLSFAALSKAQTAIYYWDFNQKTGAAVGGDSLGTLYSYANTLHQDSLKNTLPLWANYSFPGPDKAKIVYTRPAGNGALVNETSTGQEGGNPSPCADSVLVGSYYYHGIKYNGSYYYPELPWVNVLPLLGNDSGTGISVPYLGSSCADEDIEEKGNCFIKANNPANGSFMTFWMPTTGFKNIIFNFALSNSSTGNINFGSVSYTTDGVTWKNLTRAMDTFNVSGNPTPDTIMVNNYILGWSFWELRTINFTSDPTVNNNANFAVRFGYYGTISSHNTRYDNFSLLGSSITGIDEVSSINNSVNVYPNPNSGKFAVEFCHPELTSGTSIIKVYNTLGKIVYTGKVNAATNTTIDLSNNTAGLYLYNVLDESGSLVGEGKLIIQK